MRDLTGADPRTMTFGELVRAAAEAAAQVLFWKSKGATHLDKEWEARQAEIERVMNERYGR